MKDQPDGIRKSSIAPDVWSEEVSEDNPRLLDTGRDPIQGEGGGSFMKKYPLGLRLIIPEIGFAGLPPRNNRLQAE